MADARLSLENRRDCKAFDDIDEAEKSSKPLSLAGLSALGSSSSTMADRFGATGSGANVNENRGTFLAASSTFGGSDFG